MTYDQIAYSLHNLSNSHITKPGRLLRKVSCSSKGEESLSNRLNYVKEPFLSDGPVRPELRLLQCFHSRLWQSLEPTNLIQFLRYFLVPKMGRGRARAKSLIGQISRLNRQTSAVTPPVTTLKQEQTPLDLEMWPSGTLKGKFN